MNPAFLTWNINKECKEVKKMVKKSEKEIKKKGKYKWKKMKESHKTKNVVTIRDLVLRIKDQNVHASTW